MIIVFHRLKSLLCFYFITRYNLANIARSSLMNQPNCTRGSLDFHLVSICCEKAHYLILHSRFRGSVMIFTSLVVREQSLSFMCHVELLSSWYTHSPDRTKWCIDVCAVFWMPTMYVYVHEQM